MILNVVGGVYRNVSFNNGSTNNQLVDRTIDETTQTLGARNHLPTLLIHDA